MAKKAVKDEMIREAAAPSYSETLARKQSIQERISALNTEINEASTDRNMKRQKAEEANSEISRFVRDIKDRNERTSKKGDAMEEYELERLRKLQATAEAADDEENKANERYTQLSEDANALGRELENFNYCMGAEDILKYQADLAEAERQVSHLLNLIEQQQGIIDEANAGIPPSSDYRQTREDLLADIAVGKASDEDLIRLEEKIRIESEAVTEAKGKAMPIIEPAQQTIAGLQRRLESEKKELETLRGEKGEIVFQFLMAQAEQVGEEYLSLALQLIDKFKRLRAIDSIFNRSSHLSLINYGEFFIPTLNLKACQRVEHNNRPGNFYEVTLALDRKESQAAAEAEKKRYADMGIELFE